MHGLASTFILGYHGCDKTIAEKVLAGRSLKPSHNSYDWLGPGAYFWEANPNRGLEFARELKEIPRGKGKIKKPAVVGAVIDLGLCLDLTTSVGAEQVRNAHKRLVQITNKAGYKLPVNSPDQMRRDLDCAVIRLLHDVRQKAGERPIDTVRGVFLEGEPIFPGSGFFHKTHIQVCVCNPQCIKGFFRVSEKQLS